MDRKLPFVLSFQSGTVKSQDIPGDREVKYRCSNLNELDGSMGRLALGNHILGRFKVQRNDEGVSLDMCNPPVTTTEELIDSALISLSLRIGKAWFLTGGADVSPGSLLRLDHHDYQGELVFSGTDQVFARGEVVMVDDLYGLRIEQLYPQDVTGFSDPSFVYGQAILGNCYVTVKDLSMLDVGSIQQLDRGNDQLCRLNCNGNVAGLGTLQVYSQRQSDFEQVTSHPESAREPGLFFKFQSGVLIPKEVPSNISSELQTGNRLHDVLEVLPMENIYNYLKTSPVFLAAFVLKEMGRFMAKEAADLLVRLTQEEGEHLLASFLKCDPRGASSIVGAVVADQLVKLYGCGNMSSQSSGYEGGNSSKEYDPVRHSAEILSCLSLDEQRRLIKVLQEQDPPLSEEVEEYLFFPEDIRLLSDLAIQKILREIEPGDLLILLHSASEELHEKILSNLSSNMVKRVKEDLEIMQQVSTLAENLALSRILSMVRNLEERGEIVIEAG